MARGYSFDALLKMKDAGALAADAAWQVSSADKIIDTNEGATGGPVRVDGVCIIDVTAIDVTTGDEEYLLLIQGSASSTFASGVHCLGALYLGGASVVGIPTVSTTGRYEIKWTNEQDDVTYRYVRGYAAIDGTTPSINFTADASFDHGI